MENAGLNIPPGSRVHLAICTHKIIKHLLNGEKKIETRFSKNKQMPYNRIEPGDFLLFKKTGGPIVGTAIAGKVVFFDDLSQEKVRHLKETYNERIMADDDFWACKMYSNFATFIYLDEVKRITPSRINKRDRRPWVIYEDNNMIEQLQLIK